jgi:hypothetical protein
MPTCYRCGGPADFEIEEGSAICDNCEADYQKFLRERFPFGQCFECGAAYREVTCHLGKVHVTASHGYGCSQFYEDGPDLPPEPGYCGYGCRPAPVARPVTVPSLDDDDSLPF